MKQEWEFLMAFEQKVFRDAGFGFISALSVQRKCLIFSTLLKKKLLSLAAVLQWFASDLSPP